MGREQLAFTSVIMPYLECMVVWLWPQVFAIRFVSPSRHRNQYKKHHWGHGEVLSSPSILPSPPTPTHPFVLHSPRCTLLFVGLEAGIRRLFTYAGCEQFWLVDWRGVRHGGGSLEHRHSIPSFHGACFFDLSIDK